MNEGSSRWAVAFILLFSSAASYAQDACERLIAAKIPNATITLAQRVAAGTFNGPPAPFSGADLSSLYKSLPAFCRVVAEAKPTQTPTSNSKSGFRSRDGMASCKASAMADSPD